MMEYSILAESFEKMESTRKRLELTQFLVELFEKTPHEVISKIVYLIQGKLRPDFEGIELGVAEKLAIRAISKSSGLAIRKIEEEYTKRIVKQEADDRARTVGPVITSMREMGSTWDQIAQHLNALSVPTARGGKWYGKTVLNSYSRL